MKEKQILNFDTLKEAEIFRATNYQQDPFSNFYITSEFQHGIKVKKAVIFVPQDMNANRTFWNFLAPDFTKYTDVLYKDYSDSEACQINYYSIPG